MILDAHHHLWKYDPGEYGWMEASMDVLKRDYLPGDLEKLLPAAGVGGTVAVQARQTLKETRWLLSLAEKHFFIRGVVGWVDLQSERLEEQLGELAPHTALVGVRHVIQDEPDEDFMLRKAFTRGIGLLAKYNLTYDLLILPKHLERAAELAERFPEQKFVLDHIAKPLIRKGVLQPWRKNLLALAVHPNVWCKISGMVTEADRGKWKYEDFLPYLDTVTEVFGTNRIMIGSDWPVCLLAGEYREVMDIAVRYFGSLDTEEREKIFHRNCADFYNLTLS